MAQSVDLLTALPTTLACIVLRDWLKFKSVIALNTAYCCKVHRENFLDIWRSDEYFIRQWVAISGFILRSTLGVGEKLRFASFSDDLTARQWNAASNFCHNLTHIILSCHSTCTSTTCNILRANRNLESVELHVFPNETSGMSIHPFTGISLPNLSSISMHGFPFTDRHFISAMRMSKNPVRLNFSGCTIKAAVFLQMPLLCAHLKCLNLRSTNFTNEILSTLTASCPHIVHLDISNNMSLRDDGVLHVVQNLTSLRTLNIQDNYLLSDSSLMHIQTYSANTLQALYIGSFEHSTWPVYSHRVVNELLEHCTQLRTFSWNEIWPRLVDNHVLTAAALRHLTTLYLCGNYIYAKNLASVGAYAHNLTTLAIWCKFEQSDNDEALLTSFESILSGCPKLCNLYVYREFRALPDSLLDEFCRRRPSLVVEVRSPEYLSCSVMDLPI